VIRLVQPALGDAYNGANQRMQQANHLLTPIADGEAVVETIARLRRKYGSQLSRPTLTAIRAVLVERSARIDRKAALDRVLPAAVRLLRSERKRVAGWKLNDRGFRAIAPGLKRSVRRARKSMARATQQPTAENFHTWRRRVKDLWFQVRLVEARCGHGLSADRRRLETLDGCLGEYHDVILLEHVLIGEAVISRLETARSLRLLRRYLAELRHRALLLGRRFHDEKPRQFVRRVQQLWLSAKAAEAARPAGKVPCQRAA
jgi:hypothetical protein